MIKIEKDDSQIFWQGSVETLTLIHYNVDIKCVATLEDRLKMSYKTNICIYYEPAIYSKELKNLELNKMACST